MVERMKKTMESRWARISFMTTGCDTEALCNEIDLSLSGAKRSLMTDGERKNVAYWVQR